MVWKDSESKQEINTEIYLKKKKTKRQNMEETWYHNMSEENKQRLKEYQKNYHEVKKKNFEFFSFHRKKWSKKLFISEKMAS